MTDYNILNRASFDDMRKTFKVYVQPYIMQGGGTLDLGGPNNVFWIKSISWKYEYVDVGIPNAQRTRIKKIRISVPNLFPEPIDTALPPFTEPRPMVGRINFQVENTNLANNHKLDVEFYLDGVLVIPRPNVEPPTLKQMKAYIMLDSTDRGKLAMDEAAADQLDELLISSGLGSIRDVIPGGLAALKSLPPSLQGVVIQGLVAKGELPEYMALPGGSPYYANNPPLALPDIDSEKETSAFLGDLLATCPDECQEVLKTNQLKQIATAMVEKGWRRI